MKHVRLRRYCIQGCWKIRDINIFQHQNTTRKIFILHTLPSLYTSLLRSSWICFAPIFYLYRNCPRSKSCKSPRPWCTTSVQKPTQSFSSSFSKSFSRLLTSFEWNCFISLCPWRSEWATATCWIRRQFGCR